MRFDPDICNV